MMRSKTRPCWALALRYMLGGYVANSCCKIGRGGRGWPGYILCFSFLFFSDRRFAGIVCSCNHCIMTNSDNSCHLGLPYSVLGSPEPACSHVSPPPLTNSSRLPPFFYIFSFFSVLVSFYFILFYFFGLVLRPYLFLWEIIF